MDIAIVEWLDANNYGNWGSTEDAEEADVTPISSVGWLLVEDDRRVTLVGSYSSSTGLVANRITIPRTCITKLVIKEVGDEALSP